MKTPTLRSLFLYLSLITPLFTSAQPKSASAPGYTQQQVDCKIGAGCITSFNQEKQQIVQKCGSASLTSTQDIYVLNQDKTLQTSQKNQHLLHGWVYGPRWVSKDVQQAKIEELICWAKQKKLTFTK